MTGRQGIISLMGFLIIAAGAVAFTLLKNKKTSTVSDEKPASTTREVVVEQFSVGEVNALIALDGRVKAYEKIDIGAEVSGKLLEGSKTLKAGSSFAKGDLLFQMDSKDERFNLFAQRSSLLNAITQMMPDLKFDYPSSFENWKAYLDAFDVEKSVQVLPQAQNEQEKYYLAARNIFNLYYSVKSQEDRLANYNIYAPFSGVFLSVNSYPGSLVSPGMSLGQIMNTARYELSAPIPMNELKFISTGQQVELYAAELGQSWTGRVSRISNQIDQATQSVPVYLSVSGRGIKDGVFVKGTLQGKSLSAATKIPAALLVDQGYIWTLEAGKAVKKQVAVLSRSEGELVIKGLSPDDQVIVSGVNNLFEGQELSLSK